MGEHKNVQRQHLPSLWSEAKSKNREQLAWTGHPPVPGNVLSAAVIISFGINACEALSQVPGTERVCNGGSFDFNANFIWSLLSSLLSKYISKAP